MLRSIPVVYSGNSAHSGKQMHRNLHIITLFLAGLENIFGTYSSCGASGLNFSLVLTPVALVLK